MNKILGIYCATVCFFTIACFAITLGLFLQQTVRITVPALTATSFKEVGLNSDANWRELEKAIKDNPAKLPLGKSYEEMEKIWRENHKIELGVERREAIQRCINYFIILLVDLLIFIPHWRILRKQQS